MKSMELLPTDENIIATLKNDALRRNKDLFGFIKTLSMIEGSRAIALDADWGNGKTFFVKQAKLILENLNPCIKCDETNNKITDIISSFTQQYPEQNEISILPIYYDAWENDNLKDPLVSILYETTKQMATWYGECFEQKDFSKIFFSIIDFFTGLNTSNIYEAMRNIDFLEEAKSESKLRTLVKEYFEELKTEHAEHIVFFIDELDRCKPTYAVNLLERIKHYLTLDNVIFVFSVNIEQLTHTIKKNYGDGFDAYRYLDRFFNLQIKLPKPNLSFYFQSLNFYEENSYKSTCCAAIKHCNLSIREIPKFLEMAKSIEKKSTLRARSFGTHLALTFIFCFFMPYSLALKTMSHDKYKQFISGNGIDDFISFVTQNETIKTNMSYFFADGIEQDTEKYKSSFIERISKIYDTIFSQKDETTIYEIPDTDNRPMRFTKLLGDNLITAIDSSVVK